MAARALCFGEVLWDVMPTGKMPGGAPMNVAAHLQNFGIHTAMMSRIGADRLGKELEDYLSSLGLPLDYIQHDPTYATCQVKADVSDPQHVKYVFDTPTAWDFIEPTEAAMRYVASADVFVFGSLSSRHEQTKATLKLLLEKAKCKVFDVNLRPPFIDLEWIEACLRIANIVKLNDEELVAICQFMGIEGSEEELLEGLGEKLNISTICLTRGANGAWLLEDGILYKQEGFAVQVVNTIGSGDSFLAAYLAQWLAGRAPLERLRYACAVGALVATYPGATPKLSNTAIEQMLSSH